MRRLNYIFIVLGLLIATVRAEEMLYVIKVTPTLVYLDGGEGTGVEPGDRCLVLRPREKDERYARVGEVQIIRVFEEFSIAEITSVTRKSSLSISRK